MLKSSGVRIGAKFSISNGGIVQANLANDHRYMPQIVSSAIVNAPPPEGVIKTLHLCSIAHTDVDKYTKVRTHDYNLSMRCLLVTPQAQCRSIYMCMHVFLLTALGPAKQHFSMDGDAHAQHHMSDVAAIIGL